MTYKIVGFRRDLVVKYPIHY